MTKAFIFIGITLGLFVLAGFVLNALAPRKISIQTEQRIEAPQAMVYDQLRYMEAFTNWSPFKVQDPEQKHVVKGTDGQLGASYHWEGVGEKSRGYQTVAFLEENRSVRIDCQILEPFEASPVFDYALKTEGGQTLVSQQFDLPLTFPTNVVALLINLEKTLATTNRLGMERLKAYTEAKAKQEMVSQR